MNEMCEFYRNGQCNDAEGPEPCAFVDMWEQCPWYMVRDPYEEDLEERTADEAEAELPGEEGSSPASASEKPVVEKKCLRCGEDLKCLDDGMECLFDDCMSECSDYVPEGGTACGRCGTDGVCSHDGAFCHMRDYPEECNLYVEPDEEAEAAEEADTAPEEALAVGDPSVSGPLSRQADSSPIPAGQGSLAVEPFEEPEEDGRLRIVYIDVGLIDPAPWNRNIGDVSELATSIKAEGVHTPLTVCPHVQGLEGRYTAVAGNRRRAAAEKAGLKQVPCIVRPLSEVQSLTMMLSENVNRKAMTPVEEATAMQQLMLQLPENTAAAVSRATGISKTTVGRRLKLAKLPGEALAQAEERGGTLADYEKIVSLTDRDEQEKVLQAVGTKDFDREYQKARSRQEDRAAFRKHVETLEKKGAKRLTERERAARNAELSNEKTIYSWQLTSQNVGKLDRGEEWFYTASELNREIRIYKLIRKKPEEAPSVSEADSSPIPAGQGSLKSDVDRAKEELEELKREAREELDGIKAEANQIDQEFLELREGFVEKVMLNAYQEEIMETAVMAMLYVPYWGGDRLGEVGRWLGVADITDPVEVRKAVRGNPVKALLSVAYCLLEKEARSWTKRGLYDTDIRAYQMEHQKEKNLELLYRCLETMGYQMSGDELAAQAGSWDGYDRSARAMKSFKERKKELERRIYK